MDNFLYHPINKLKQISDNIWVCDGDIIKMDMIIYKTPFTTRMTIVKLSSGDLFIHSPINITDDIKEQIDQLGNVKYIIAPNKIHYAYVKQWSDIYKNAKVFAVNGVEDRAKKQNIAIDIDYILTDEMPKEWQQDLDYCLFKGSSFMDEAIFRHKASNTIIVVDLIENFEKAKVPFLYYVIFKMVGVVSPNGKAPLDLRLTFSKKGKKTAKKCLEIILSWQVDIIVMAHGKIITKNAKNFLQNAFKWLT